MALPKRPSELLQLVLSAFKDFEKKLDKLQEDVYNQGQTLTDLKIMVADISGLPVLDVCKQSPKKFNPVHHEALLQPKDESHKPKRKSLPNKFKAKSLPFQNVIPPDTKKEIVKKAPSAPLKQDSRLSKTEAPHKATTLKTQKNTMEKARYKSRK